MYFTEGIHPESPEHLKGKELIAHSLKSEIKEYSNAEIEFEYIVKEIKREADIMMIFPNGWLVAHEIQLSYIKIEELEERTKDYLSAGIDVIWWFGKDAHTETNRNWSHKKFGFCYTLNITSD